MKHSFIDQYSDRDSFIHRLDPRTKFLTTLAFILAVTLTPPHRWQAFVICFAVVAALMALSRVPVLYILKRSLVIMPFVLLVTVFVPFFKENGLVLLAAILVKAWLSVLSLILLTATTPVPRLLEGLERLRLPRVMVMVLSFMYRYIFVLVDEVMRMRQARDSRSSGGSRLWQVKTIGRMVGTLFIRSYERGERVYAAMLARGFNGQSRTLNNLSFKLADAYFTFVVVAVLLLISALSLWGG
jgi:cobalt/nickel transport system permease protein